MLAIANLFAILAGVCAVGVLLSRIDHAQKLGRAARADVANARVEIESLRAEVAALDLEKLRADVDRCRARTENLRRVLETLIPSGVWPERVRLPDPPPGWAPWPEGNKYGHAPKE